MNTLEEIRAAIAAKSAELKALTEEANPTTETLEKATKLDTEIEELETKAAKLEADAKAFDGIKQKAAERAAKASTPVNALPNTETGKQTEATKVEFKGRGTRVKHTTDEKAAYALGQSLLAAQGGERGAKAIERLQDLGYDVKDMNTYNNANGGFIVPTALSNEIINNAEQYGVARQNMRVQPMAAPLVTIPRITGGLTAVPVGEGATYGTDGITGDAIELVARKWGVTVPVTDELSEDAIASIGDLFAFEAGKAFALAEDGALFNGDGTSTYHGIKGLKQRFTDLSLASAAGAIVAAGSTAASVTNANLLAAKAALAGYVANPKWYVSRWAKASIFDRLIQAAGGITGNEMANGVGDQFGGDPVVKTQVLPSSDSSGQILAYYGDLDMAAKFGEYQGISIGMSTEELFSQDKTVWKARNRMDMNVHDVGSTTAGGAIVCVYAA